jgi:hypothetical protein
MLLCLCHLNFLEHHHSSSPSISHSHQRCSKATGALSRSTIKYCVLTNAHILRQGQGPRNLVQAATASDLEYPHSSAFPSSLLCLPAGIPHQVLPACLSVQLRVWESAVPTLFPDALLPTFSRSQTRRLQALSTDSRPPSLPPVLQGSYTTIFRRLHLPRPRMTR